MKTDDKTNDAYYCQTILIGSTVKATMDKRKKKVSISYSSTTKLVEGEDYYINQNGLWLFTSTYHLKRGYCCGNKCLHCPYQHEAVKKKE